MIETYVSYKTTHSFSENKMFKVKCILQGSIQPCSTESWILFFLEPESDVFQMVIASFLMRKIYLMIKQSIYAPIKEKLGYYKAGIQISVIFMNSFDYISHYKMSLKEIVRLAQIRKPVVELRLDQMPMDFYFISFNLSKRGLFFPCNFQCLLQ